MANDSLDDLALQPMAAARWRRVYKHSGTGVQSGSVQKLVNAAERGAPTRLVIRQGSRRKGTRRLSTYDAEAVWVNQRPDGWLVSAQVAPLVRADLDNDEGHRELSDPAERTTILVDSDGRYEVLVWRAGDGGTAQHGDATRAVTWLVQS